MSDGNAIDWAAVLHAVDAAHGDLEYARDCLDEYQNGFYDERSVLKDGVSYDLLDALVDMRSDLFVGMVSADKCGKRIRERMRVEARRERPSE